MAVTRMYIDSIASILDRDLSKLAEEISLYNHEDTLWITQGDIKNSAGNLCLHLCGNLRHFIGAQLGNTGYMRNREFEFAAKGISKAELLNQITLCKTEIVQTLKQLPEEKLAEHYPIEVFGAPMTTLHFLNHLTAHFSYHLGQINYHRRILA